MEPNSANSIKPFETLQDVFNVAYRGLAAQGFVQANIKASDGRNYCAYRGANETKCAIGHCIPDELVYVGPDGGQLFSITTGIRKSEDWKTLFSKISVSALESLQSCHDRSFQPERMKERLEEYARAYGLTVPDCSPATETA
jgi:hypothetical protein